MFVCPKTHQFLKPVFRKGRLISFVSTGGASYEVKSGIPDFFIGKGEKSWLNYYADNAKTYDQNNHLTFQIQGFDENQVRRQITDMIVINRGDKILEMGCGTGRDSIYIAQRAIEGEAELYCVDASLPMLEICKRRLQDFSENSIQLALANGEKLPFADNYFNRFFSFTAFAPIENKEEFLKEIVRVVKPGGTVIIGSEGILPSLKGNDFGRKLINNCSLYDNSPPLEILPYEARNVCLNWILNGIIFILKFEVDKNPLNYNYDLLIPGKRGGTINSRFYGHLGSVSPETKKIFEEVVSKVELSKYEWLNEVIKAKARKDLNYE